MENNEIIQRLLQDDKETRSTKNTVKANKDGNIQISKIRVVTAKYKVYIVLLLILIALFSINYIPSALKSYENNLAVYDQINTKLDRVELGIKNAKDDVEYLCNEDRGVVNNEEILKSCLNTETNCANLPDSRKIGSGEDMHYELNIPLSYLQLHSLYNKKMPVDEKRVLKNLNEYLIKKDIVLGEKERVGEILKIEIGDPETVKEGDEHFFQVPVDVEIEFKTIKGLTGFLYNVEKKIIDEGEDRILYKIQSVSYDIVTHDEPQITKISMIAYYYYDEKFNSNTVDIIANINGEKVKLKKKDGTNLPSNIILKEQIKEFEKIEAKDLFEMPERIDANFKDGKGIDLSKKGEDQEISIDIRRKPECDPAYYNTDSNKKIDDGTDTDSGSMFDKIFSSINI